MANKPTLTKYSPASVGELFAISFPLMLSALSANLMLFVDRLILAHYSTEAMNSSAAAGIIAFVFLFGVISIASIAEVFVGQYNGAKRYYKVAEPVWQMIWFSLGSIIIFWPVAMWGAHTLIPESLAEQGVPYFKWLMFFGPVSPIVSALAAFFAGRGKTKIITYATLLGNILNLALDLILVFGIENIIPPLGTAGAAIATIISQILQVLILGAVFLNFRNRKKYNTSQAKFVKSTFLDCIKVGYPSAIGHIAEMIAWSTVYHIMAAVSIVHVTVHTIGQNIFILFVSMTDGMQKGVIAISSNLIGAKQVEKIKKLIYSSIKLHLVIIIITAIPLLCFPESLIDIFEIDTATITMGDIVAQQTKISLIFVWLYIVFDGMVWILAGVLTSAGDTKFIMVNNALCSWALGVLPIFIVFNIFSALPSYVWVIITGYSIINLLLFTFRYKSDKWKKLVLS